MSHNTKYYRKKLKKTESSKKIDVLFRQQALASENSANITPKQTEKVEAPAEIAESSASTKNCPSTSTGVPSQCDDTHSNHDSSDDNQSSDGSQSTQDTCLFPEGSFEHPQQMVNQIVNQVSEFAYESVKSKKLNKRNT